MRTAHLLPVSPSMHCSQGGVPAWGVYLLMVHLPGGVPAWIEGVPAQGGVPARLGV